MNLGHLQTERAMSKKPGVRLNHRTGQYHPTVNGIDLPTTTFDESRALELANDAARGTKPQRRDRMYDRILSALKHVHETPAVNIDWQMVADTIKAAQP